MRPYLKNKNKFINPLEESGFRCDKKQSEIYKKNNTIVFTIIQVGQNRNSVEKYFSSE